MPKTENKVGKHLLESITTGMYDDCLCIFREYIQNSTDAIDAAIRSRVLSSDTARIDIRISPETKRISVIDNGIGIQANKAFDFLRNIGDSQKIFGQDAGFRGIGRLGGVSYCETLSFTTSFSGEPTRSTVTWDCKKLRALITPGLYNEYDLFQVLDECVSFYEEMEETEKHYFIVTLDNIDEHSAEKLLDPSTVMEYIREVAPLPYNSQKFVYDAFINKYLHDKGFPLETYNIYFNNSLIPLYKPYKTRFNAYNTEDDIYKIEFRDLIDENGSLLGVLWYAVTSWLGTVDNEDKSIRGLRLRKKNILIGNEISLSKKVFFGQERFNGWFIGEVFVFADLIPNARRDFFEQEDPKYPFFEKALKGHTLDELSKIPSKFSKARNITKKIIQVTKETEQLQEEIEKGISSYTRKQEIIRKIEDNEKSLQNTINEAVKINKIDNTKQDGTKDHSIPHVDVAVVSEANNTKVLISDLKEVVSNSTDTISTKLNSSYSKDERKIFDTIIRVLENQCGKCICLLPLKQTIIDELNKKCNGGKKK